MGSVFFLPLFDAANCVRNQKQSEKFGHLIPVGSHSIHIHGSGSFGYPCGPSENRTAPSNSLRV